MKIIKKNKNKVTYNKSPKRQHIETNLDNEFEWSLLKFLVLQSVGGYSPVKSRLSPFIIEKLYPLA